MEYRDYNVFHKEQNPQSPQQQLSSVQKHLVDQHHQTSCLICSRIPYVDGKIPSSVYTFGILAALSIWSCMPCYRSPDQIRAQWHQDLVHPWLWVHDSKPKNCCKEGDIKKIRSLEIIDFDPYPLPSYVLPCSFSNTHSSPPPQDTFVSARSHPLTLNFYTCLI